MRPKKQKYKNINNKKGGKKWNPYKKAAGKLKINESGKTRNREPEVVSLQNDARKCYLKSQLLIKKYKKVIE